MFGALHHADVFSNVNDRLDSMRNDMLRLNPFSLDIRSYSTHPVS
jgi:hypothetical protein